MGQSGFQTTEKYIHPKADDLKQQHWKYSPLKDISGY
jgi:hypothetical protein